MKRRFLNLENLEDDLFTLEAALSLADQQDQILKFKIGGKLYGIEIKYIKEMTAYNLERPPKPVPNLPEELLGVYNLRGEIIPVIDMRKKFGLPEKSYTKYDIIMVLEIDRLVFGIMVDEVEDMVVATDQKISIPAQERFLDSLHIAYLLKNKAQLIPVLNPESLLRQEDYQRALRGK